MPGLADIPPTPGRHDPEPRLPYWNGGIVEPGFRSACESSCPSVFTQSSEKASFGYLHVTVPLDAVHSLRMSDHMSDHGCFGPLHSQIMMSLVMPGIPSGLSIRPTGTTEVNQRLSSGSSLPT